MKFIAQLFIITCFFPYLDFLKIGTDTQPNALMLGLLIFLGVRNKKINSPLILLWATFFISIFLVFFNNLSFFFYLKNTLNYLSPAMVATTTYLILNQMKYKLSFKVFYMMMLIYCMVGLVQMYFIPDFMYFLVNGEGRGSMVGGRGVVSLSAEPAFYGTTCILFICYSLLQYTKRQNFWVIGLLLFQLFFISRSATAIAILLFGLGIFTVIQIFRLKFKYVLGVIVFILIATPIMLNYWNKIETTRAGVLAQTFVENPLLITKLDGSVGIRFTGTVAPFLSMRHHYMKPQGLGYYIEFLRGFRKKRLYNSFLSVNNSEKKPRISGSLNMVLYQLGFLGLLFPLAIYLAFRGQLSQDSILLSFILLIVTMMTQIQMMNGMIGYILGTAIYRGKHLSEKSSTKS